MTKGDGLYFHRRLLQEEAAAHQATCIEARISHQKMADAYRRRCAEWEAIAAQCESGIVGLPFRRLPTVSLRIATLKSARGSETVEFRREECR